ncbi:acyl-CoA hydrolase [Rhodococcus percolatus]|nr:acyl-CoA hydrolase [Rhodococcus opacus]MBP2204877.1 acyl-CoA hydrolase [Rhodococcus opacus]
MALLLGAAYRHRPDPGQRRDAEVVMVEMAPTDVNWGGKTHGGTVMRWIDEAAYLCGTSWNGA